MPGRRSSKAARRRRERNPLTLSDDWRVWVVDNLLAGLNPRQLIDTLVENHIPAPIARAEVEAILRSPTLVACRRMHQRIQRLQQVAALTRALAKLAPDTDPSDAPDTSDTGDIGDTIERRERISADDFFRHHFAANRPLVLTGALSSWPALARWTPAYFKDKFGPAEVEIVSGRDRDPDADAHFDQHRQKTTMADYVDRVLSAGTSNDIYMIAHNRNMLRPELARLFDDIVLDHELFDPERLHGGVTLWFGPAGTITPLHHDTTNILFCQIHGRKRVVLIAPFETRLLDCARGFYSELDLEQPETLRALRAQDITIQSVDLMPGEALFIPVGWWHHVKALDISITFSLLNFRRPNAFPWYRPGSLT
jgi:hypothetical protein